MTQDTQNAIVEYLDRLGFVVIRINSGRSGHVRFNFWFADGQYHDRGISDLLALRDGVTYFIECKRPGETTKPDQAAFLDAVNQHGGVGFRAEMLEDVVKVVNEHRR